MRIAESFKGVASGVVDVWTGRGGGDCGYAFETGRSYLIYAYRQTDGGALGTGICSRTAPIEQAAGDLTYLRGPFRGPATLGRIEGEVIRSDLGPSGEEVSRSRMPGIPVILESSQGKHETRTGPTGAFEFRVPAGHYTISSVLPEGWYSYQEEGVHLRDPRGCALISFYVRPDGRIAGRLVDADGRPGAFVPIHAAAASSFRERPDPWLGQTLTGADGDFELRALPPGEFVIGLALAHGTKANAWLSRLNEESIHRITVEAGRRVSIEELVLPPAIKLVQLSGQIVDAAGGPLTNTFVDIMPGTDTSGGPYAGPFKTDAKGQFRVSVFDGHRYRLFAQQRGVGDDSRTVRAGETNAFTATTDLAPFRITVQKQ